MWHVSISLQRKSGRKLDDEHTAEQIAVRLLEGVGGDREWWRWGSSLVGHLRVPLTESEALLVPPGVVVMDAGDEGIERARTSST